MRQELRKILARVFVAILIFLIGVVIYKQGNPYAYPGLENRILFVLVPSGIVLLYLYLEERETRNRLLSAIRVTIGKLHESKFIRVCERTPSLIRTRVSKVQAVIHSYLYQIYVLRVTIGKLHESKFMRFCERCPSLIRTRVSKVLAVVYTYLHKMSGYMLKQDPKQVVSHAFLGMLLIVALQSVIPQPSLEWAKTPVMIAAVALGVVTFYLNRDKLGEIEDEARQEEIEEKRRELEFGEKYPRIDQVWGVRWIVRWMYKEGGWYSLIFIAIIINAFFIRYDNLGMLPLQNDEFLTSAAVNSILNSNLTATDFISGSDSLASPNFYSRAWPYSLSVAAIVEILGSGYPYSAFALRLFSVIVGTFTLIFFYFLLRHYKINKFVSLFTIYSFSTFFVFVYYSRTARMYALLLLLFYINLVLIYNLFDSIRNSNISTFSSKKYFLKILMIIVVLFISINIHKNILTLVIPFYLLSLYYSKSNEKIRLIFILETLLLLSVVLLHYFEIFEIIPIWYFNTYGETYYKFLEYNYHHLAGKETSIVLFVSLLVGCILKKNNINKLIKISYFIFIPIILFFIYLVNGRTFYDQRYIIFLYPLYSFICIYTIYYMIKISFFNRKIISTFSFILLFTFIISNIQIAGLCYESSLTDCPISHESRVFSIDRWNYNYDEIYSTIKNSTKPNDILVGRVLYPYYLEKYNIKNDIYVLTNRTKIQISTIQENDVIFVIHPQLVYHNYEIETNQYIYAYLYNNKQKSLLYLSEDRKTAIYKIEKLYND